MTKLRLIPVSDGLEIMPDKPDVEKTAEILVIELEQTTNTNLTVDESIATLNAALNTARRLAEQVLKKAGGE